MCNGNVVVMEVAARTVQDREILDRPGVTILEAAEGDAARLDAPTAAERHKRVGRGPAAFLQSVKRERPGLRGNNVGDFLDVEIIRQLLELHLR